MSSYSQSFHNQSQQQAPIKMEGFNIAHDDAAAAVTDLPMDPHQLIRQQQQFFDSFRRTHGFAIPDMDFSEPLEIVPAHRTPVESPTDVTITENIHPIPKSQHHQQPPQQNIGVIGSPYDESPLSICSPGPEPSEYYYEGDFAQNGLVHEDVKPLQNSSYFPRGAKPSPIGQHIQTVPSLNSSASSNSSIRRGPNGPVGVNIGQGSGTLQSMSMPVNSAEWLSSSTEYSFSPGPNHPHAASLQLPSHDHRPVEEDVERHRVQLLYEKKRRRRESHNAVERRRRDNINEKIQELATLLPPSMLDVPQSAVNQGNLSSSSATAASLVNGANKPNKGIILRKSVDYIRQLQLLIHQQGQRNMELEAMVKELQGNRNPNSKNLSMGGMNSKSNTRPMTLSLPQQQKLSNDTASNAPYLDTQGIGGMMSIDESVDETME